MQMKTDNGQQDKNARIFVMTEGNMDETSSSLAMIKNYLVDRESIEMRGDERSIFTMCKRRVQYHEGKWR